MSQTLSLSLRPRTLESFIGNLSVTTAIKMQMSERIPVLILLSGIPGCGKTTLARIIAGLANPGVEEPDTENINGASENGIDRIRDLIEGSNYRPFNGQRKVIIIDEAHRLTGAAQEALKIPTETENSTTLWIFTSSDPDKLDKALRSRCVHYALKPMGEPEIRALVQRASENTGGDYDTSTFISLMVKSGVGSPREILMAWELYSTGTPLAECLLNSEHEPLYADVAKAVLRGDWNSTRNYLIPLKVCDFKALRAVVAAFIKAALLKKSLGLEADVLSETLLGMLQFGGTYEDGIAYSGLVGVLYRCCKKLQGLRSQ